MGSEQSTPTLSPAAAALLARGICPPIHSAVVTGTGLGGFASQLTDKIEVPYSEVPGFLPSSVSGHVGHLVFGALGDRRVVVLHGRSHYYEAGNPSTMRAPIAALAELGVPIVVLTNAAGSTTPDLAPGSLVVLSDHINFSGTNPLIGEQGDERFVSMTDAYDPSLAASLRSAGELVGVGLRSGVYMWFSGPSFETPAEISMARLLGADLVGMSTVPEVILARRYGLRVAAISVVTNFGAGVYGSKPSHTETKARAAEADDRLGKVLGEFAIGPATRTEPRA